jgi:hypothetical protein
MKETILVGRGREMAKIPRKEWELALSGVAQHLESALGFMSKKHHEVRNFVVSELPRVGEPLSPGLISERLKLPGARLNAILNDLEKHLTFLFRNEQGAVVWAYPVTVARTPHRVHFNTGEQLYAA